MASHKNLIIEYKLEDAMLKCFNKTHNKEMKKLNNIESLENNKLLLNCIHGKEYSLNCMENKSIFFKSIKIGKIIIK